MQIKQILFFSGLLISFLLTACTENVVTDEGSVSPSAAAGSASQYEALYKEVTDKYQEVDKAGGAWAFTAETMDKAAEAAKKKDFDGAIKLLKQASDETAMAKAQLEQQKNAAPHLF